MYYMLLSYYNEHKCQHGGVYGFRLKKLPKDMESFLLNLIKKKIPDFEVLQTDINYYNHYIFCTDPSKRISVFIRKDEDGKHIKKYCTEDL